MKPLQHLLLQLRRQTLERLAITVRGDVGQPP